MSQSEDSGQANDQSRSDLSAAGDTGDTGRRKILENQHLLSAVVANEMMNERIYKENERLYKEKYFQLRQQELDRQVMFAKLQHLQQLQPNNFHQQNLQDHFKTIINQQRAFRPEDIKPNDQTNQLINSLKNKEKDKESAVASNAVKKHLQQFVIGRQKNKDGTDCTNRLRYTPSLDSRGNHHEGPPFFPSLYDKYNDFPLRKTASEPNLKVRSRLKLKLSSDLRSSPLFTRRHEDAKLDVKADIAKRIKKKLCSEAVMETNCNSAPNSGPSSPPNSTTSIQLPGSSSNMTEESIHSRNLHKLSANADLYSSPSLPNLAIGLNKKHLRESSSLMQQEGESSKLAVRTASLPGPLAQVSPKQKFQHIPSRYHENDLVGDLSSVSQQLLVRHPSSLIGANSLAANSSTGPIRNNRRHKVLSRTHSAPTTAASQLQQHILQRKQKQMLQQQKRFQEEMSRMNSAHSNLPTHIEGTDLVNDDYTANIAKLHFQRSYPNQFNLLAHHRIKPNLMNQLHANDKTMEEEVPKAKTLSANFSNHIPPMVVEEPTSAKSPPSLPRNKELSLPTKSPPSVAKLPLHRPLLRTNSSPAPSFLKHMQSNKSYRFTTGISYSPIMLKHGCACGDDHVENAGRLRAIWARLTKNKLVRESNEAFDDTRSPCELIDARKATTNELQLVHTRDHTFRYGTTSLARKEFELSSRFILLPCGGVGVDNGIDIDTVWNELDTMNAVRMAVGCTVDLALDVAEGKLKNGFALVRPPGHHAQRDLAMAFCYFNSVAVAARKLQKECSDKIRKILILDWDIHHCNGTQNIFYDDPNVLVISIHRYDNGNFFPGTGAIHETGEGVGTGRNVNIAFSDGLEPPIGDADYLAVFRCLILPIIHQFNPDFILVSSGFSAAKGHSSALGGYIVTPQCFGYLTKLLMKFASGKVVMALEGGFDLEALCNCTEACVRTLLGDQDYFVLPKNSVNDIPTQQAVKAIKSAVAIQERYWKNVDSNFAVMSHSAWLRISRENETLVSLASLSVNNKNSVITTNSSHFQSSNNSNPHPSPTSPPQQQQQQIYQQPVDLSQNSTNTSPAFNHSPRPNTECGIAVEDTHMDTIDDGMSADSSPLDVVNISAPSSPAQGSTKSHPYDLSAGDSTVK